MPYCVNSSLDWIHLMNVKQKNHEKKIRKATKTTDMIVYNIAQRVQVQHIGTKRWHQQGKLMD